MCKVLHGAGIRANDVISFVSENRHEIAAIAFGAFYLNAIIAPINVTYTERKINASHLMAIKAYHELHSNDNGDLLIYKTLIF
jgi:long-subunit acyl-CoA synthetase (AMP-forming)